MPTAHFTLKEYSEYTKKLGPKLLEAAKRGLRSGGERVLQAVVRRTDELGIMGATGYYRQSWRGYPQGDEAYVVTTAAP